MSRIVVMTTIVVHHDNDDRYSVVNLCQLSLDLLQLGASKGSVFGCRTTAVDVTAKSLISSGSEYPWESLHHTIQGPQNSGHEFESDFVARWYYTMDNQKGPFIVLFGCPQL
jgi:hypothetical protein